MITVRSDEEWRALRAAMGDPDWATDPGLEQLAGRTTSRSVIEAGLEAWTRERTPREVMELLQAVGVPCGIVAHPAHHMSDPQMLHREYAKPVEQQELSTILLEGPAFLGSDLPEVITEQAPLLGEHTREVAERLLGLSAEEIEELITEGVLEDPPTEFKLV